MDKTCETCVYSNIPSDQHPCDECLNFNLWVASAEVRDLKRELKDAWEHHMKDDAPGGSTPSQYALPEGAKELQDLIEYREMNFALGNIFKACYRRGTCSHSDELRDMRKIKWFAEREIARLEKENEE